MTVFYSWWFIIISFIFLCFYTYITKNKLMQNLKAYLLMILNGYILYKFSPLSIPLTEFQILTNSF